MAGDFIRVRCPDCENLQTIFERASTDVACAVCGHAIATPTGGKADVDAEVMETIQSRDT